MLEIGLVDYVLRGDATSATRQAGLRDLRQLLGLAGGKAALYPADDVPPGQTGPRVTFRRTATERLKTLRGNCGLVRATLELACYGGEADRGPVRLARWLARAARRAFDGHRGTWQTTGEQTFVPLVQKVIVGGEEDDSDAPSDGSSRPDAAVRLELVIWYTE